ncbi:MAG: hypothetical protein LBK94_03860 [Prevotellaceae bacterium]|jgi:hypothetical protein|nr:hypothetical protein [Prevotellaceae bacterium]
MEKIITNQENITGETDKKPLNESSYQSILTDTMIKNIGKMSTWMKICAVFFSIVCVIMLISIIRNLYNRITHTGWIDDITLVSLLFFIYYCVMLWLIIKTSTYMLDAANKFKLFAKRNFINDMKYALTAQTNLWRTLVSVVTLAFSLPLISLLLFVFFA